MVQAHSAVWQLVYPFDNETETGAETGHQPRQTVSKTITVTVTSPSATVLISTVIAVVQEKVQEVQQGPQAQQPPAGQNPLLPGYIWPGPRFTEPELVVVSVALTAVPATVLGVKAGQYVRRKTSNGENVCPTCGGTGHIPIDHEILRALSSPSSWGSGLDTKEEEMDLIDRLTPQMMDVDFDPEILRKRRKLRKSDSETIPNPSKPEDERPKKAEEKSN